MTFCTIRKCRWLCGLVTVLVLLSGTPLTGQTPSVSLESYHVGSAEGEDLQMVRAAALENLMQKIQIFVQSEFKRYREESTTTYSDSTIARVITRSSMKLSEVDEELAIPKAGVYHVTKYVRKATVDRIFERRKQTIIEYLDIAGIELGKAQKAGSVNLSSVLSDYYKAFLLVFTLRDHDTLSYSFRTADPPYTRVSKDLRAGIPYAIENIINGIRIRPIKRIEDANIVWKCAVDYRGVPISKMQYSFYDGAGNTFGDVHNGETLVTFFFPPEENREREIDCKIEYRGEEDTDDILEIARTISAKENLAETAILTLPGERRTAPPKTVELKRDDRSPRNSGDGVPAPIRELIAVRESWVKTKLVLTELSRRKRVIVGRREDFESAEGLYLALVEPGGGVTLLKCRDDILYDIVTGKTYTSPTGMNRPAYWIEPMK